MFAIDWKFELMKSENMMSVEQIC